MKLILKNILMALAYILALIGLIDMLIQFATDRQFKLIAAILKLFF